MSTSPSIAGEKKHWWLSNTKVVDKYIREARTLIGSHEHSNVSAAVSLLDAALVLSPRLEAALELKARSLLFLGRFREVADMLQEYIPSYKMVPEDESSTSLGSNSDASNSPYLLSKERAKLLSKDKDKEDGERSFRCFSVSDLKRRVMAGLWKNCDKEGQWRYLILGQACCHLGLMEDAVVLLQTGRRLASAAFRLESISQSDDNFVCSKPFQSNSSNSTPPPPNLPQSESESASHLLSHIKLLLRRRAAAFAALDAGIPSESIRHFSKILDGRRGTPHAFAASCFVNRAMAYRAAGRLVESIADCNRALALDPMSIPALWARADLLESVRVIPDCLRDLDHLKLLYDSILRDWKLPGPAWKPHYGVRYRDIPSCLRALTTRIQECRQRVASGEGCNIDYYALIGVRRGCTRSELERAHLLLALKHKPDKAAGFVDRLEYADEHRDLDSVRDQARMSALILYRMLQKGYSSIMSAVMYEEAMERQRVKEATSAAAAATVALQAMTAAVSVADTPTVEMCLGLMEGSLGSSPGHDKAASSVYQGVFCRDLAAVGSILSQVGNVGFNRTIPVKYEALSC